MMLPLISDILRTMKQLKEERDEAIEYIRKSDDDCITCKHFPPKVDGERIQSGTCETCESDDNWEWRGL